MPPSFGGFWEGIGIVFGRLAFYKVPVDAFHVAVGPIGTIGEQGENVAASPRAVHLIVNPVVGSIPGESKPVVIM